MEFILLLHRMLTCRLCSLECSSSDLLNECYGLLSVTFLPNLQECPRVIRRICNRRSSWQYFSNPGDKRHEMLCSRRRNCGCTDSFTLRFCSSLG
ncbi:hypothetical protein Nmel_001003 [Mimus melanotis]